MSVSQSTPGLHPKTTQHRNHCGRFPQSDWTE